MGQKNTVMQRRMVDAIDMRMMGIFLRQKQNMSSLTQSRTIS
jgi:hypothetical protein